MMQFSFHQVSWPAILYLKSMVKAQVEGFRCVLGRRGRPGDVKVKGDSKDQLGIIHAHKWLLSRSKGLF